MSYRRQLIEWGESGALYPNLVPDEASQAALRSNQTELKRYFHSSVAVENLHSTLFYIRPKALYNNLRRTGEFLRPPEFLYMELSNIIGTAALLFSELELPVSGLDRFGHRDSTIAVALEKTAKLDSLITPMKELLSIALSRSGVSLGYIELMRSDPEHSWSFNDSTPHISLLKDTRSGNIPDVELPDTIKFDDFNDGGVKVPTGDPYRWYTMPGLDQPLVD